MAFPRRRVVTEKEIKEAARLLLFRQDQPLRTRPTATAVSFDGDGLDIEKQQHAAPGQMPPDAAQAAQNGEPLWVIADNLALDPLKVQPPFLSRRRRCSRLISLIIRAWRTYVRSLPKVQRP